MKNVLTKITQMQTALLNEMDSRQSALNLESVPGLSGLTSFRFLSYKGAQEALKNLDAFRKESSSIKNIPGMIVLEKHLALRIFDLLGRYFMFRHISSDGQVTLSIYDSNLVERIKGIRPTVLEEGVYIVCILLLIISGVVSVVSTVLGNGLLFIVFGIITACLIAFVKKKKNDDPLNKLSNSDRDAFLSGTTTLTDEDSKRIGEDITFKAKVEIKPPIYLFHPKESLSGWYKDVMEVLSTISCATKEPGMSWLYFRSVRGLSDVSPVLDETKQVGERLTLRIGANNGFIPFIETETSFIFYLPEFSFPDPKFGDPNENSLEIAPRLKAELLVDSREDVEERIERIFVEYKESLFC